MACTGLPGRPCVAPSGAWTPQPLVRRIRYTARSRADPSARPSRRRADLPAATPCQHAAGCRCGSAAAPQLGSQAASLALLTALAAAVVSAAPVEAQELSNAAAPQEGGEVAKYVPGPVDVGWQIYVGSAVGCVPFVVGSYEFGKRILIQRRCEACNGTGLVQRGKYLKKCVECGGFLPWLGWKMFWTSTAAPGNGGPLLQPRGQTSVFYSVPPPRESPPPGAGPPSSADAPPSGSQGAEASGETSDLRTGTRS